LTINRKFSILFLVVNQLGAKTMSENYTVPAELTWKGVNAFILKKNTTRCWYTGLPVVLVRITGEKMKYQNFYYKLFPNIATKEHIYCNSNMVKMSDVERADINSRFNLVPACRNINNAIADAPIPVKLEIRQQLHKICSGKNILDGSLFEKILQTIKIIVDSYLIDGKFPDYIYEQENEIFNFWNKYFKTANWEEIYNVN
jgi:hypothetical protein